jgi:hypothetical protein
MTSPLPIEMKSGICRGRATRSIDAVDPGQRRGAPRGAVHARCRPSIVCLLAIVLIKCRVACR